MCQSISFKSNLGDFHSESNCMKHGQSSHYTVTVHKTAFQRNIIILKPSKHNEQTNNDGMKAFIFMCAQQYKRVFFNLTLTTHRKNVCNVRNDHTSDFV